jgi:hypothetical protein
MKHLCQLIFKWSASHRGVPGSIREQPIWDLWWTEYHYGRLISEHFGILDSSIQLSFHHCPVPQLWLLDGRTKQPLAAPGVRCFMISKDIMCRWPWQDSDIGTVGKKYWSSCGNVKVLLMNVLEIQHRAFIVLHSLICRHLFPSDPPGNVLETEC